MQGLLSVSSAIRRAVEAAGAFAGWLFLACVIVICFDVVSRKFGYQIPYFGSTRLQELEWHLHTGLFSFWLGLAYLKNAHVRIDIAVIGMSPRSHAWLEFWGCLIFAIPYCLVAVYFGFDFAWRAWLFNEASDSANGLPYRVVPKGVILLGLVLLLFAVVAVLFRLIVFLWGPERLRAEAAYGPVKAD